MRRAPLFNIIALAIFGLGIFIYFRFYQGAPQAVQAPSQLSSAAVSQETATSTVATTTPSAVASTTPVKKPGNNAAAPVATSSDAGNEVGRIPNPYSTPAYSFDQVNQDTRAALVNVLCQPNGGSLEPISGSGVIIDPHGVILTNAHVAQYVLLSESPQVDLDCTIRTGSPAKSTWKAAVLFIPPVWVDQHASEILNPHPMGTGEHDYALLYITGSVNGDPLPAQFPYVSPDTRPAIGFPGDDELVASYPAEFIGGIAAQYDLYAVSSVTSIKQLLTFSSGTPDLMSLGGIIEAQSGSSGGAVVNAWEKLVGLIATTSSGDTTADRDLRAIALSYINTDLQVQSGKDLNTILAGDLAAETVDFTNSVAPGLVNSYLPYLAR